MNIRTFLAVAFLTTVAGCSQATDEQSPEVGTDDITDMKSPEALARWFRTNHSLGYFAQYLDTRPGAVTPTMAWFDEMNPLRLTPASANEDAIKEVLEIAKAIDAAGAPVEVDTKLDFVEEAETGLLCPRVGVNITRRSEAEDMALFFGHFAKTPEDQAAAQKLAREASLNVELSDGHNTAYLSFGVVKRSLNPAAGSEPAQLWTLLGADVVSDCYDPNGD